MFTEAVQYGHDCVRWQTDNNFKDFYSFKVICSFEIIVKPIFDHIEFKQITINTINNNGHIILDKLVYKHLLKEYLHHNYKKFDYTYIKTFIYAQINHLDLTYLIPWKHVRWIVK